MSFINNLKSARSHIVFILGLATAVIIIYKLEAPKSEFPGVSRMEIKFSNTYPLAGKSALTDQEYKWAVIAWQYFKNNFQEKTGLVNSAEGYPSTTMWDTGSYLLAIISAYKLGVIDKNEFNFRITRALESLAEMPLFENQLPNKAYHTVTLDLVNYQNVKTERGIGWSAIDIGRLAVPFNILAWNHPEHVPLIKAIMSRWDFSKMIKDRTLYGARINKFNQTEYVQEGRLGYEQYSAKAFSILGFDVFNAADYTFHLKFEELDTLMIAVDSRDPKIYHAQNFVVSESYILDGLEYGFDDVSREFAYRIYLAQKERFKKTGIVTAVSEDNLDRAPYFVYNTVYSDGKFWNCITEDGKDASQFRSLSTKAAVGWSVLFNDDYRDKLIQKFSALNDEGKGWYSGLYENSGKKNASLTCNTNAIILEALCYKVYGNLLKIGK